MALAITVLLLAAVVIVVAMVRTDITAYTAGFVALVAATVLASAYNVIDERRQVVRSIETRFEVVVVDPADAPAAFTVDHDGEHLTCTTTHDANHLVCVTAAGEVLVTTRP